MSMQFFLMTDVIFQGILNCDKNGVTLPKTPAQDIFLHCINVCDDAPEMELTHFRDTNCRNEVADIIENYHQTKTKSTDLKMSIVLTDDFLIYQCPQWMSMTKKKKRRK